MDTAVEIAKCQEAAEKAVKPLIGIVDPQLTGATIARFTTALLDARGDALKTYHSPYSDTDQTMSGYLAGVTLELEARNRRMLGL